MFMSVDVEVGAEVLLQEPAEVRGGDWRAPGVRVRARKIVHGCLDGVLECGGESRQRTWLDISECRISSTSSRVGDASPSGAHWWAVERRRRRSIGAIFVVVVVVVGRSCPPAVTPGDAPVHRALHRVANIVDVDVSPARSIRPRAPLPPAPRARRCPTAETQTTRFHAPSKSEGRKRRAPSVPMEPEATEAPDPAPGEPGRRRVVPRLPQAPRPVPTTTRTLPRAPRAGAPLSSTPRSTNPRSRATGGGGAASAHGPDRVPVLEHLARDTGQRGDGAGRSAGRPLRRGLRVRGRRPGRLPRARSLHADDAAAWSSRGARRCRRRGSSRIFSTGSVRTLTSRSSTRGPFGPSSAPGGCRGAAQSPHAGAG